MSGRRSASAWNTRASMYMPVPAISHAMTAPSGPVALANVRGSEKMPAPTIPPTTIAVSAIRDIFCSEDIVLSWRWGKVIERARGRPKR